MKFDIIKENNGTEFIIRANASLENALEKRCLQTNQKIEGEITYFKMIEHLKNCFFKVPEILENKKWRDIRNYIAHGSGALLNENLESAWSYYSLFMRRLGFV